VLKTLLTLVLLLLAAPASARAATATMTARDVPLHGDRALASSQPRFDMVALHWRGTGTVSFRTRAGSHWSRWRAAAPEADDLPDASSSERRLRGWRIGNPWWTGGSDALQVRAHGRVSRVRAYFVRSPVEMIPPRRLSLAGSPPIVTRAQWQADESIRRAPPAYANAVRFAVVHHTAGESGSSPAEAAAIVRAIELYHVRGNGWNDIGYNFLVDRWGNVYEGRYGGIDRAVIGAHAEGFNTGSVGVALIGTFGTAAPPAAQLQGLEKLLAWRLDLAHVDPLAAVIATSGGNPKYAAGTPVTLRGVVGHRDTGPTSCPGDALYSLLASVRSQVNASGAPKLYSPAARGAVGGPVTFTGRLTTALPWTVTVKDSGGKTLAVGSGTGAAVSWTWDSSGQNPSAAYAWVMAAGADVRPASGTLGARATALALTNAKAMPARIDGTTATSATISYTLSVAATVTAELLNSARTPVATLFSADKPAGAQSFVFTADGVPDGSYTIRLTARDATGRTVTANVPILISRVLLAFTASANVVSPNGDGRLDAVTFKVVLAQPSEVSLGLATPKRTVPLFAGALPQGTQEIAWNGRAADGTDVRDGAYRATLAIGTPPLALAQSVEITVDTRAPAISLVSVVPLRIRVSEPVRITGTVNGARVNVTVKGGISRLRYAGVYLKTLRLVARDAGGNSSRVVTWRR
jgi:N-acetylmuramoyl-L-alanine amidase